MDYYKIISVLPLLACSACDPVTLAFGGTAIAGTVMVRNDKGIGGSLADASLQATINKALIEEDGNLFDSVELCVKHGVVVVIGYVQTEEQHTKILEIINSVKGYGTVVYDEIRIQADPKAGDIAQDSMITSRIKAAMTGDSNVSALNYDVTTVKGIVYICGTASSVFERDIVLNHARTTSGVKEVVSYIRLKKKES